MRADLLHVVVPYFNPRRYQSHALNAARHLRQLKNSGAIIHVAEVTYGDAPPLFADLPGITHHHLQAKSVLWVKESAIAAVLARLPRDWAYVAWVDGDITFTSNSDWAGQTVYALQHYDFVQPWEHCYDLGPHGEHLELHHSFGRQWIHEPATCDKMGASGYRFAHPGYAMAATRAALEVTGGLIETAVLGAADHHMCLALIGQAEKSFPGNIGDGYKRPILDWQTRATRHIVGNVGYVGGTIAHAWHGPKAGRGYISRWDILVRHAFDPATDLKRNTSCLFELAGTKPGLRRDIMAYFASRHDDASAHGALALQPGFAADD